MRQSSRFIAGLSLFVVLAFAATAFAAAQTTCPVMGFAINKKLYADYKGERVYFCCNACPPQFAQDPQGFIKKMKDMGQEPEKVPSK
jgi:YHS domain-containing protein